MNMRRRQRRHLLTSLFLLLITIWILLFVRNARRRRNQPQKSNVASLVAAINAASSIRHGRRYVVVTAATYSYRHLTANMLCSLRKTSAPYVLISLDARMHAWALSRNITSTHMDMSMSINTANMAVSAFGTDSFNQVTRDKVSAAVAVLNTGTDVIYVDSDVYFCSARAIDRVLSFSLLSSPAVNMVSQRSHVLHQPINSGIYYVRSSANMIRFLREEIVQNTEKQDEQVLFNRILCRQGTVIRNTDNYPVGCTSKNENNNNNKGISVRFMDAHSFPIGCTRLKGQSKHIIEQEPDAVNGLCRSGEIELLHYSCVEGDRKIEEMKQRGMWAVDESGRCSSF